MGNHGPFSFGGTKGLWLLGSPLVCFQSVDGSLGAGKPESWEAGELSELRNLLSRYVCI
jgi:hypothetical protein